MRISIATEPSRAERPNEDYVAATDDLVVLLDGASTPDGLDTGCTHGTRWFARRLGAEIFARLSERPDLALADGVADAIEAVAERHAETCDVAHPGHPSATVAILREAEKEFEYFVLADSSVVLDTTAGTRVVCDNRLDQVAAEQHDAVRRAKQGTQEHARAFEALTVALRGYRNTEQGFWVASVDPTAAHRALTGSVERSSVRQAALVTDGASILVDRFHVATWPEAMATLAGAGPHALIREVRALELSDAATVRWPRTKVHDDATAVYCDCARAPGERAPQALGD